MVTDSTGDSRQDDSMRRAADESAGLIARVRDLERICHDLGDDPADEALEVLREAAYALIGDGLAAGHSKFAELASIVEVMLAPVVARQEPLTQEFREILRDYLKALERLARNAPVPVQARVTTPPREALLGTTEDTTCVHILEPDPNLASDLSHQLAHFGYRVCALEGFEALLQRLETERPDAVVMDVGPPNASLGIEEAAEQIREKAGRAVPILALTQHGDMENRLRAARADVDAYFVKPVDMHDLIDRLDEVTGGGEGNRFHVLIVEDSQTQATYYSAILQRAGMECTAVRDPLRVLDVLAEQPADLILMDMYMPGCNGTELAKVVRQFPMYASIPIVFLSAETEIDRQLDAMSLGGDDFLTKPIDPAHLIRSVAIRAERARTLRSFMLTDNLTGLLNHTRIKEQLHNEVARARRKDSGIAFAMLDIDHFKSVNDTHGHHVGDRVIKTLARVLPQRLRSSDYIGRYGGEEFAVILPEATAEDAVAVLDRIRRSFAKVRHFSPEGVFNVTFSGGVASYPDVGDAVNLALEADRALYNAKRAGRDRIVTA